nr:hypothetical protein [Tanacetum cinerariifolium]
MRPVFGAFGKAGCANCIAFVSKHVTPSRSSRSGDHRRSRIGVKVGWFQGDILTLGIIKTVQNHHLVTKETTEIMKIKEADMKFENSWYSSR